MTKYLFNKYTWFFVAISTLLFFWLSERMVAMEMRSRYEGSGIGLNCGIALVAISFAYVIYHIKSMIKIKSTTKNLFIWFLVYFNLITVVISLFNTGTEMSSWAFGILPLLLFLMNMHLMRKTKYYQLFAYVMLALMIGLFYKHLTTINVLSLAMTDEYHSDISSYYILFIIPFALCIKNKYVRVAVFVIGFLTILSSAKRSVVLSFIVMSLIYVYVRMRTSMNIKSDKTLFKKIFILFFLGIVVYYLIVLLSDYNKYIIEKFSSVREDEGSGRYKIWNDVLNLCLESNPVAILFGHGYLAVGADSPEKLTAHNDYLEVFYDYGLIGFTLLVTLLLNLVRHTRRLIKRKSELAAPLAASLALFFIVSMMSHIVIYFAFFSIFGLFWGYIVGSSSSETAKLN